MPIEIEHFPDISSEAGHEIDPALVAWARSKVETVLKAKNSPEAANNQVLELSEKARHTGAMVDRLKAWLFCKTLADVTGTQEAMGQQQILAGFAHMHPSIDDGYYAGWIKTHPGPDDAPRAAEDLKLYSDIFSPGEKKK